MTGESEFRESEFRELLEQDAANATAGRPLDAASIVRRSKRRRLPGQVAVGTLGTLAIAGIGISGASALRHFNPVTAMSSSAGDSSSSESEGIKAPPSQGVGRVPADRINLCGAPVAAVGAAESGLELTPHFAAVSPAGGEPITGTVTLTNTGTEPISGTTAASPAITISQDGVVAWHSNGPMIMLAVVVELAPGQSMQFTASMTPVRCGAEDDLAEGFRADLPALTPGKYQVSAAIDLTRKTADGGPASNELVTGPRQTIELR